MAKFHINKHGVPAVCRAKEGNCPLGGAESHFDNQEEAQKYVDKQSEKSHGLLPTVKGKVKNVEISQQTFDSVFPDSLNEHGYQVTGPHIFTFEEDTEYMTDEMKAAHEEVYNKLPQEFDEQVEEADVWVLVKEDNIESHMINHVLSPSEQDDLTELDEIVAEVENKAPNYVEDDAVYVDRKDIDYDLKKDIAEFASDTLKEEAKFSINGKKMHVVVIPSPKRNWAKEYFDSGRFEKFKEKNEA